MEKNTTKFVRIGDLVFDESYQRVDNLNIARINDIAKNYDHAAVGVILVSRRDGDLFVIDGMHRVKACAKKFGHSHQMLAMVYDGLTVEEEARMFWKQTKRTPVSPYDQLRARLSSGEDGATGLRDLLSDYDLHFSRTHKSKNGIASVKSVEKIYNQVGEEKFRAICRIISNGCRMGRMYPTGLIFHGVHEFLKNYPEADHDRLIKAIAKTDPDEFNRTTVAAYHFVGKRNAALCEAVRKEYNRGQRTRIGEDNVTTINRKASA